MKTIFPKKLHSGDTICVIAQSYSMAMISEDVRTIAKERFQELGLHVIFGTHVEETDVLRSSSITSRINDLHNAFNDKNVQAILTIIGGFNSNQLLEYIDWDTIKRNPKIFCGYSDITILANAIFKKTGLITYSGPHYSTFGQKKYFEYTLEYFKRCLMDNSPYTIAPSKTWSDDAWYIDQNKRTLENNEGYWLIQTGKAEGTIIGGNLGTFSLLQGTQYIPNFHDTILFIEDDFESTPQQFDRYIQSLILQPGFSFIKALVIGKFQKASKMERALLEQIILSKKELARLPVIGNVNFGHTDPKITFPIGGIAEIIVNTTHTSLTIKNH